VSSDDDASAYCNNDYMVRAKNEKLRSILEQEILAMARIVVPQ
jgi:hypothetical protein